MKITKFIKNIFAKIKAKYFALNKQYIKKEKTNKFNKINKIKTRIKRLVKFNLFLLFFGEFFKTIKKVKEKNTNKERYTKDSLVKKANNTLKNIVISSK